MVNIKPESNTVNITVSSSGTSGSVNITPDYAQYYSEKAREWAISNRMVDGVDYSSKYYSNKANESAVKVENSLVRVEETKNNAIDEITSIKDSAVNNVQDISSESITDIEQAKNNTIQNIADEGQKQITNIERTGFYMRDDKLYFINSEGKEQKFNPGGAYVGQTIFSILPQTEASLHLLDGTVLDGNGIYKGFVDYIKGLDLTASYFTTEANWQTSVSTYGVCGKFVYNASANTVRLPKVTGILEGTIDANALGDLVEAGLPAHTHTRGTMNITGQLDRVDFGGSVGASGAFSLSNKTTWTSGGSGGTHYEAEAKLNASNSWTGSTSTPNYTADINTTGTVQPQTIKGYYYIVVATSTKTDIEVDIDNVVTDLNGKVNKSGDTMSGSLYIEKDTNRQLMLVNTSMDYANPPTSTQYNQLHLAGKDRQIFGFLQCRITSDGSHLVEIGAKHPTANNYTTFGVGYDKDGNAYVSGTSPVRQYMAQMSMPSNKYVDLTLGASGSTYTAPADGYFNIAKLSSSSGQFLSIFAKNNLFVLQTTSTGSNNKLGNLVPVLKGETITITYNAGGNVEIFRFIYAEGSR